MRETPERHPLVSARDRTAVLLLDLQAGPLMDKLPDRDGLVAAAARLARVAGLLKIPVLVTEQNAKALGTTHPALREALPGYAPIDKMSFSAFGEEAFEKALKATGRTHLVVGGIMSHICVCQTVLDALHRGYIVHLAADAVACWKASDHAAGLEKMRKAGASIESAEVVLYEWLDRAGTPEFKSALPFLKG
jgi:nicotinamidase-related amidase